MKEGTPENKSFSINPDLCPELPIEDSNQTRSIHTRQSDIHHSDDLHIIHPLSEFEAHARQHPDAIAAVIDEIHLTYGQLNRRANQMGHFLQAHGIEPEILVGICLERSLDLLIGILGVLKAGGTLLPLEPSYPSKRISFMLEDGKPTIVLTHEGLSHLISLKEASLTLLDTDWKDIALEDSTNLSSILGEGNARVVFYTSGSTGTPKGVLEVHQKLSQHSETDNNLQKRLFDGI